MSKSTTLQVSVQILLYYSNLAVVIVYFDNAGHFIWQCTSIVTCVAMSTIFYSSQVGTCSGTGQVDNGDSSGPSPCTLAHVEV